MQANIDKCQRPLIPSLTYFTRGAGVASHEACCFVGCAPAPTSENNMSEAVSMLLAFVFIFYLSHLMKERQRFLCPFDTATLYSMGALMAA